MFAEYSLNRRRDHPLNSRREKQQSVGAAPSQRFGGIQAEQTQGNIQKLPQQRIVSVNNPAPQKELQERHPRRESRRGRRSYMNKYITAAIP